MKTYISLIIIIINIFSLQAKDYILFKGGNDLTIDFTSPLLADSIIEYNAFLCKLHTSVGCSGDREVVFYERKTSKNVVISELPNETFSFDNSKIIITPNVAAENKIVSFHRDHTYERKYTIQCSSLQRYDWASSTPRLSIEDGPATINGISFRGLYFDYGDTRTDLLSERTGFSGSDKLDTWDSQDFNYQDEILDINVTIADFSLNIPSQLDVCPQEGLIDLSTLLNWSDDKVFYDGAGTTDNFLNTDLLEAGQKFTILFSRFFDNGYRSFPLTINVKPLPESRLDTSVTNDLFLCADEKSYDLQNVLKEGYIAQNGAPSNTGLADVYFTTDYGSNVINSSIYYINSYSGSPSTVIATYFNEDGCQIQESFQIDLKNGFDPKEEKSVEICQNQQINLTNTSENKQYFLRWEGEHIEGDFFNAVGLEPRDYVVTYVGRDGLNSCIKYIDKTVTVLESPLVTVGQKDTLTFCKSEGIVNLNQTGTTSTIPLQTTVKWHSTSYGVNVNDNGDIDISNLATNRTYEFVLTVENGSCPATDTLTVIIKENPTKYINIDNQSACGFGDFIYHTNGLSAAHNGVWMKTPNTDTLVNGNIYLTGHLTENDTVYMRISDGKCLSDPYEIISTINTIPAIPEVVSTNACGVSTSTIEVLNPKPNETYQFANFQGFYTVKGEGTTFETDLIGQDRNYYARAKSFEGCLSEIVHVPISHYNLSYIGLKGTTTFCKNSGNVVLADLITINESNDFDRQNLQIDGDYVINNELNTDIASEGEHTIIFHYTDEFGCTTTYDYVFEIIGSRIVDLGADTTVCNDSEPIELYQFSPFGRFGDFSGNGVYNDIFNVHLVNGNTTIDYIYNDGICNYQGSKFFEVLDSPDAPRVSGTFDGCIGDDVTLEIQNLALNTKYQFVVDSSQYFNANSITQTLTKERKRVEVYTINSFSCKTILPAVYYLESNNPQGEFFASDTVLKYDDPVWFEYIGSPAVNFFWEFGEGSKSYQEAPKKYYYHHGHHTVTLTMESEDGCKSVLQKTNYINVDERYISDEELFSHVGPDNTIGQRRANYVKASPNPLEDQILKIEWYGDYDKIEIISSYGIAVKAISLSETEKENKAVEIKLEGIQAGIYTILINGKNQSQTKLIKL